MRALVEHLLTHNLDAIVAKSLAHCHARNLTSILLIDTPEARVRLFVAHEGHELYRNSRLSYKAGMSLGFHPHHCDLTLYCIRGSIWNWVVGPDERGEMATTKYRYSSAITGSGMRFIREGTERLETVEVQCLSPEDWVQLEADQLHTVGCAAGETAAWFVFEGKDDPAYESYCYSTSDLESLASKELYVPVTEDQVFEALQIAGLLDESEWRLPSKSWLFG